METALKNVAVTEPEPPEGLVRLNNEWYYEEFAKNTGIGALGATADKPAATGPARAPTAAEEQKSILDLFRN